MMTYIDVPFPGLPKTEAVFQGIRNARNYTNQNRNNIFTPRARATSADIGAAVTSADPVTSWPRSRHMRVMTLRPWPAMGLGASPAGIQFRRHCGPVRGSRGTVPR
jgi:hypothetical protein